MAGFLWTIWEMTLGPYVDLLGSFFWIAVIMLLTGVTYIRTRDFGPAYMVFTVSFLGLYPVIPAGRFWGGAFLIVTLGITYSIYRFFIKDMMR